jgi:hypothetical protein
MKAEQSFVVPLHFLTLNDEGLGPEVAPRKAIPVQLHCGGPWLAGKEGLVGVIPNEGKQRLVAVLHGRRCNCSERDDGRPALRGEMVRVTCGNNKLELQLLNAYFPYRVAAVMKRTHNLTHPEAKKRQQPKPRDRVGVPLTRPFALFDVNHINRWDPSLMGPIDTMILFRFQNFHFQVTETPPSRELLQNLTHSCVELAYFHILRLDVIEIE